MTNTQTVETVSQPETPKQSSGWRFDRAIKLSDIITPLLAVVTITISLTTLSGNLRKDIELRERQQADKIRTAAAKALTNLETLQSIQLSLFESLQPVYVDVSQKLYEPFTIEEARDSLWQSVTQRIAEIDQQIVDKEIIVGYADLLVDFPGIRTPYLGAVAAMNTKRDAVFSEFIAATEANVLNYPLTRADYQSAMLGGDLRETSAAFQQTLKDDTDQIIAPLRACVLDIIEKIDSEIIETPGCAL